MNILVLVEDYPMPGKKAGNMFFHMRNKYYASQGAQVTVLNFRAEQPAVYDGINVITWDAFAAMEDKDQFDLLVLHAANIRHHYRFLKQYGRHFKQYVFVYHGHEVLRVSAAYPPVFSWKKQNNPLLVKARDLYDSMKLMLWRRFFQKKDNAAKSNLIFVSNWMRERFFENTKLDPALLQGRTHIIYNSVGQAFEEHVYQPADFQYDFVTIRRNMDGEKYCVDVVNDLAKANPQYRFLVVGMGELFQHIQKADNLTWQNRTLFHNEMFEVLNHCRFALMPTKNDTQGVMMCEMATYGIPLITSDLPVCQEVLAGFDHVAFISNTGTDDLAPIVERLAPFCCTPKERNKTYFAENTSGKEFQLFQNILHCQ